MHSPTYYVLAGVVLTIASTAGLALLLMAVMAMTKKHGGYEKDNGDAEQSYGLSYGNLNPWIMQRDLMTAAPGQRVGPYAQVNETSLLYWALIAEEFSEMTGHLIMTMKRVWAIGDGPLAKAGDKHTHEHSMLWVMYQLEDQMAKAAKKFRVHLAMADTFEFSLSRMEAKELMDDTTDITVVNCGFAVSSGLPGAEAYRETVSSNLSKANPRTGKIDVDASGKWIKGPNYKAPDFTSLLDSCVRVRS